MSGHPAPDTLRVSIFRRFGVLLCIFASKWKLEFFLLKKDTRNDSELKFLRDFSVPEKSPQRCLFDGPGILKINNLSCAHYENEELDSVYQSVLEELGGGIEADSLGKG